MKQNNYSGTVKSDDMPHPTKKITAYQMENGNGWNYAINGMEDQPNWDVGECYENQTGYATKEEAMKQGNRMAHWMTSFAESAWPTNE